MNHFLESINQIYHRSVPIKSQLIKQCAHINWRAKFRKNKNGRQETSGTMMEKINAQKHVSILVFRDKIDDPCSLVWKYEYMSSYNYAYVPFFGDTRTDVDGNSSVRFLKENMTHYMWHAHDNKSYTKKQDIQLKGSPHQSWMKHWCILWWCA